MVEFYRKTPISAFAELNEAYADLYDGAGGVNYGRTFKIDNTSAANSLYGFSSIKNGMENTKALFKTTIADRPDYGSASLKRMDGYLFVEDILMDDKISASSTTPSLSLFKIKQDALPNIIKTGSLILKDADSNSKRPLGNLMAISATNEGYISDEERFTGEQNKYSYSNQAEYEAIGRTLIRTRGVLFLEVDDAYEFARTRGGGVFVEVIGESHKEFRRSCQMNSAATQQIADSAGNTNNRQVVPVRFEPGSRKSDSLNMRATKRGTIKFTYSEIKNLLKGDTTEVLDSSEEYNDQITTGNTFFSTVKHDNELTIHSTTGEHKLIGTAVSRFSTKNLLEGDGKAMEMYAYWEGNLRVENTKDTSQDPQVQHLKDLYTPKTTPSSSFKDTQETFASYGPIPFPAQMFPGTFGEIPVLLSNTCIIEPAVDAVSRGNATVTPTQGTPITIDTGLSNATGISKGTQYYVSETAVSGAAGTDSHYVKLTTDPKGASSGNVAIGGGIDNNVHVYSRGGPDGVTATSDYGAYSNGSIEIDLNLHKLEAAQCYEDGSSSTDDKISLVRRAFVVTLGYFQPNPEDTLMSYVNKHIPFGALSDTNSLTTNTTDYPFLGWSFIKTVGSSDSWADGIHVCDQTSWHLNKDDDAGGDNNKYDIYILESEDSAAAGNPIPRSVIPQDSYFTMKLSMAPCTALGHTEVQFTLLDPETKLPLPLSTNTTVEVEDAAIGGTTHFMGDFFDNNMWWTGRTGCDAGGLDFWTKATGGGVDYFEGGTPLGGGPIDANAIWPRYLTVWLCNTHTETATADADKFLAADGGEKSFTYNSTDTAYNARPTTSTVYIDGIRFRDFNFKHTSATISPTNETITGSLPIPQDAGSFCGKGIHSIHSDLTFPGTTTLAFGAGIQDSSWMTASSGIFLNNFTSNLKGSALDDIPYHNVKTSMTNDYVAGYYPASATIFDDSITAGGAVEGAESFYGNQSRTSHYGGGIAHNVGHDLCLLIDPNPASSHHFNFSSGIASVDSFTNKGFLKLEGSMQTAMDVKNGISTTEPDFQMRELIYCSARVLKVVDRVKGIYKVDTVEPFRGMTHQDDLIAYLYGSANRSTGGFGGSNAATDGGDQATTSTGMSLLAILDSKHIQIKWDGKSTLGLEMTSERQLPYLMFSPYKVWLFTTIKNWDVSIKNAVYQVENYTARGYDSAIMIDDDAANIGDDLFGVLGPTFNEFLYNDAPTIKGMYENSWKHSELDDDGMLTLDKDFGFGVVTESDVDKGGFLSKTIPKINQYSIFNMDKLFDVESQLKPGDEVGFTLQNLSTLKSEVIFHNNVSSDVTTTVHAKHNERLPYFLTVFEDELPSTPELTVKPFRDDPFLPEFIYNAKDDDLWYGFMIIDDKPINSQYHGAILHLPLNELGNHGSKINNVGNVFGPTVTSANIDVSDDQIDLTAHLLTAGTPIVIDTLTNATGITEGIRYYVSETSLVADSFRITTQPSGSASGDVTIGGSDDTNIRFTAGSPIRNLAYLNNTDTNASASEYANIVVGEGNATGGKETPKHDIEGLGGYAYRFESNNSAPGGGTANSVITYDPDANNTLAQLTSEMSAVVHVIPSEVGADANGGIFGSTNFILRGDSFRLFMNADGILTADFYNHSGSGSHYVRLKSRAIPVDGKTPTNIIMTFDKNLKQGNCKLFINGALHDVSGLRNTTGPGAGGDNWKFGDNMWLAGNAFSVGHTANGFDGIIQEVVVYEKCIYPVTPQADKFVLSKPLQDIENGSPVSYTARLFMKDYHNISGGSTKDVATSPPTTWRKAAFRLGD